MALLTPPPTANRLGHDHLQPGTNRLAYYEDYYGVVNPDENLEGQPELCESETDSDDGLVPETGDNDGRDTGKRDGFFKKYTEREWKGLAAAGLASPPNGHGEINSNVSNVFDNVNLPYRSSPDSTKSDIPTSPKHDVSSANRHKIRPSREVGLSVEVAESSPRTPSKKLTPRKLGLFSKLSTEAKTHEETSSQLNIASRPMAPRKKSNMTPEIQIPDNTAGDGMDDLLMSGGLGNLEDGFPTLEEQPLPLLDAQAAGEVDNGYQADVEMEPRGGSAEAEPRQVPDADLNHSQSNTDRLVSDENAIEVAIQQSKVSGHPTKSSKPSLLKNELKRLRNGQAATMSEHTSERPNETQSVKKPSSGRYITRTTLKQREAEKEAEKRAKRPKTRSLTTSSIPQTTKKTVGVAKRKIRRARQLKQTPAEEELTRVLTKARETSKSTKVPKVNWEGRKMITKPGGAFVAIGDEGVDADQYAIV